MRRAWVCAVACLVTGACRKDAATSESPAPAVEAATGQVTSVVPAPVEVPSQSTLLDTAASTEATDGVTGPDAGLGESLAPEQVASLVAWAGRGTPQGQRRAVQLLAGSHPRVRETPEVLTVLREALHSKDHVTVLAASEGLSQLGEAARPVMPDYVAALREGSRVLRQDLPLHLRALGPAAEGATEGLLPLLTDEWIYARAHAASALGAIGKADPVVLQALTKALGDHEGMVVLAAAQALVKLGAPTPEPVVATLVRMVTSPHAHERAQAASLLGELGPRAASAREALAGRLEDPESQVREAAAGALARVSGAEGKAQAQAFAHRPTSAEFWAELRQAVGADGGAGPTKAQLEALRDFLTWDRGPLQLASLGGPLVLFRGPDGKEPVANLGNLPYLECGDTDCGGGWKQAELLERRGEWLRLRTGGREGWAKHSSVATNLRTVVTAAGAVVADLPETLDIAGRLRTTHFVSGGGGVFLRLHAHDRRGAEEDLALQLSPATLEVIGVRSAAGLSAPDALELPPSAAAVLGAGRLGYLQAVGDAPIRTEPEPLGPSGFVRAGDRRFVNPYGS